MTCKYLESELPSGLHGDHEWDYSSAGAIHSFDDEFSEALNMDMGAVALDISNAVLRDKAFPFTTPQHLAVQILSFGVFECSAPDAVLGILHDKWCDNRSHLISFNDPSSCCDCLNVTEDYDECNAFERMATRRFRERKKLDVADAGSSASLACSIATPSTHLHNLFPNTACQMYMLIALQFQQIYAWAFAYGHLLEDAVVQAAACQLIAGRNASRVKAFLHKAYVLRKKWYQNRTLANSDSLGRMFLASLSTFRELEMFRWWLSRKSGFSDSAEPPVDFGASGDWEAEEFWEKAKIAGIMGAIQPLTDRLFDVVFDRKAEMRACLMKQSKQFGEPAKAVPVLGDVLLVITNIWSELDLDAKAEEIFAATAGLGYEANLAARDAINRDDPKTWMDIRIFLSMLPVFCCGLLCCCWVYSSWVEICKAEVLADCREHVVELPQQSLSSRSQLQQPLIT